jgi:hypothetical protein
MIASAILPCHYCTSIEVESDDGDNNGCDFLIEVWRLDQMFYTFEFEFDILLVEIDHVACAGPHSSEARVILKLELILDNNP